MPVQANVTLPAAETVIEAPFAKSCGTPEASRTLHPPSPARLSAPEQVMTALAFTSNVSGCRRPSGSEWVFTVRSRAGAAALQPATRMAAHPTAKRRRTVVFIEPRSRIEEILKGTNLFRSILHFCDSGSFSRAKIARSRLKRVYAAVFRAPSRRKISG